MIELFIPIGGAGDFAAGVCCYEKFDHLSSPMDCQVLTVVGGASTVRSSGRPFVLAGVSAYRLRAGYRHQTQSMSISPLSLTFAAFLASNASMRRPRASS